MTDTPRKPIRYEVTNRHTGNVTSYKTGAAASKAMDRIDNAHGSYITTRRGEAGATRHKLAEMLREELKRMGVSFSYFDGESLVPVSGYWRSQDVYRWESVGLNFIPPETGGAMPMTICGWDPMPTLVRAKRLEIVPAHHGLAHQYEANPL